ncbi:Sucrose synthase 1 [Hordeum vulgare]|nr:Sucrose synthase 1 [Hordeum vulgare]
MFSVTKSVDQGAVDVLTRWQQVALALPEDLFMRVLAQKQEANFESMYLGTSGVGLMHPLSAGRSISHISHVAFLLLQGILENQPEYLQFKEQLVRVNVSNKDFVLELDFEPFNASFPRPSLSKSIGNGVQFLNRHLSSKLFHDKDFFSSEDTSQQQLSARDVIFLSDSEEENALVALVY